MTSNSTTFKIGITGVMGSGKSLVGRILKDLGIAVLDTDEVVHELYRSAEVIQQVTEHFGTEILETTSGETSISRAKLAKLIFNDLPEKQWLEAQIHPLVRQKTEQFLDSKEKPPVKAVLVPLLFESGSEGLYDATWAVTVSDTEKLISRIQQRNPEWSHNEILARLNGQWSQADKIKHATVCIDNSESPDITKGHVIETLQAMLPPNLLETLSQ